MTGLGWLLGDRPVAVTLTLLGVTVRADQFGLSVFDTHRFDAAVDAAEHDCTRDHPDGACDAEPMAFRDDDLLGLFEACRLGRLDEVEAMAEFQAGVRADPERPA